MINEWSNSPHRHTRISSSLREKILAKYGYKCVACGRGANECALEIAFIQALASGGEAIEENLTVLCPDCHRRFDSAPREIEFVCFLEDILKRNPNFHAVQAEAVIGKGVRYRADLLAERIGTRMERLLIECKRTAPRSSHLSEIVLQMQKYQEAYGNSRRVLALPATLPARDSQFLSAHDIELWDLKYISNVFKDQIVEAPLGYYQLLFSAQIGRAQAISPEQKLIEELRTIQPGNKDWSVYQSLVGQILELLFCPPLVKPLAELADGTKTNRRDFILPNYSQKGFWTFLRERYTADYVVIDAKNYTSKIKKGQVLQLANYLKPHGAGLFGIIICRKGPDSRGSLVTLREQWLMHQKLIIVLTDEDLESMLLARSDGQSPEEIIGTKIEEFRLSM